MSQERNAHVVVEEADSEHMLSVGQTVSHLGVSLRVSCQYNIGPALREEGGKRR